jgi:hypothetical protein
MLKFLTLIPQPPVNNGHNLSSRIIVLRFDCIFDEKTCFGECFFLARSTTFFIRRTDLEIDLVVDETCFWKHFKHFF